MLIENSGGYGLPDMQVLAAFEKELGVSLPDEYRQFLLEHNGGTPVPAGFRVAGEGMSSVENLYGLNDGPDYQQLQEIGVIYRRRMPPGLLPIGDDPNGNVLCLGLAQACRGHVLFWDHERELPALDPISAMPVLASSFMSFLGGLEPLPDQ